MTEQAETTAPETAAEQEAARAAADAKARRVLAVFDSEGVLVGRNGMPTDEEWDAAPARCRFPHGFDNAVGRYKVVEYEPGRWRFEPIVHARDEKKENIELLAPIVGPLARVVFALSTKGPTRQEDIDALAAFLTTFDGA